MKNQQFPLGGFTLSRNFNLSKHVDFVHVNKIGAINGKPRVLRCLAKSTSFTLDIHNMIN